MRRKESALVAERNLPLVERMKQIKAEHPFWGYRRIWAHLKYVDRLEVNKKRVYRLMQKYELLVQPNQRLKAIRTPGRSKPRPNRPNQWWGIDMTKVMVDDFGWMYIVIVLDWHSKKIVGYYAGLQCRSRHWLEALDDAANRQFKDGVRGEGLSLMSDNGCQPTSITFMKTCRDMDRVMPTRSGCSGQLRKSFSGFVNGRAPLSWLMPSEIGSKAITETICTHLWATGHRCRQRRSIKTAWLLS
jgi:putative transposase